MNDKALKYMVSLSFAGEDREYVKAVADGLKKEGITVFYDEYEQSNLWGKDLYSYLSDIYQNNSKYVIIFISKFYANKLWTNHEMENAQAKAFRENSEYILPVKLDETRIPSIPDTRGYLDATTYSPKDIVRLFKDKLINSGVCLTKQKTMSNDEIINDVKSVVYSLRREIEQHDYQLGQVSKNRLSHLSHEEAEKQWTIDSRKRTQMERWLIKSYEDEFKSKTTLLKNELVGRLNIRGREKYLDFTYETPMNSVGLQQIISDLEKLSMML